MICKRCGSQMAEFKEKQGMSFICPICGRVEFVEFYNLSKRGRKNERKNTRKM